MGWWWWQTDTVRCDATDGPGVQWTLGEIICPTKGGQETANKRNYANANHDVHCGSPRIYAYVERQRENTCCVCVWSESRGNSIWVYNSSAHQCVAVGAVCHSSIWEVATAFNTSRVGHITPRSESQLRCFICVVVLCQPIHVQQTAQAGTRSTKCKRCRAVPIALTICIIFGGNQTSPLPAASQARNSPTFSTGFRRIEQSSIRV